MTGGGHAYLRGPAASGMATPLWVAVPLPLRTPASRLVSSTGMTNLVDGERPDLFQRFQVLKGHGRRVHVLGHFEDPSQCGGEPLRP